MHLSDLVGVSYIGLWIVVIVQSLVLLEVLRQLGVMRERLGESPSALFVNGEGLERGVPAPAFSASELHGGEKLTEKLFLQRWSLVVFLSTRCQACVELAPHVGRVARDHAKDIQIVVVCTAPSGECSQLAGMVGVPVTMLLDHDQELKKKFNVLRTPGVTLIDQQGVVRLHAIPNDWRQLEGIIDEEVSVTNASWIPVEDSERTLFASTGR